MSTFVLTFKLETKKYHEDTLNKSLEVGRRIYNACLSELHKRHFTLKQSKEHTEIAKMPKGREKNKRLSELDKKFGVTEYSLHKFVKYMQHHFVENIDSVTAQTIATRVFRSFQNYAMKRSGNNYYRKYGDMNSIEGKSNIRGIRFKEDSLIWRKLIIPVIIKKNDLYAQMALENRIKYCRIVRKLIRGKYKFYIQLVMEGVPPVKYNKETGEVKNSLNKGEVGIDIGIQTVAVVSKDETKLLELATSVNNIEKEKRILQRKLDRQRRTNNPHKYNENGTIKENREKWIISNKYIKTKNEFAEMQRKIAAKRKQDHNILANWVLSLGDNIKVETMNYKGLKARAKNTTVNEKTGRINSKKRFGKSIANKAPAMFLEILNNKLKWQDKELKKIDNYSVKASQYNHIEDNYVKKSLSERWNYFGDIKIQRDLYSAFLIMNVKDDLKTIDRNTCIYEFDRFKMLHDLEIDRIKSSESKLISSMGI